MPFTKGKSGNPGGRPRLPDSVKSRLIKRTPKNVDNLIELADQREDLGVAFRATLALHEMYYGKPEQFQMNDTPTDGTMAEILRNLPRTVGIPKTKL